MDRSPENLTTPSTASHREAALARPRDLALLLLALGTDPPRERARDQQADRAGALLRHHILDRLAALDPEPGDLEAALATIVEDLGEPSGPPRALALHVLEEWQLTRQAPTYAAWLLGEALEKSAAADGSRRGSRWTGPPEASHGTA